MTDLHGQQMPDAPTDYTPLSPLSYLARTVSVQPTWPAIVHGFNDKVIRRTWLQLYERCCSLANALAQEGVGKGDTVIVMMPNTPAMVEASFAIPMIGARFCVLDPSLEPALIASMLDSSGAKAMLVDAEFAASARCAIDLRSSEDSLFVVDVVDPVFEGAADPIGSIGYEELLKQGSPAYAWDLPSNETEALALSFASEDNTFKMGQACSHRGAAISALAIILEWDIPRHPVYLWTQPMFHGNGWSLSWAVAARAGVNVCLRDGHISRLPEIMAAHGVTHFCGPAGIHTRLQEATTKWQGALPKGVKGMVVGESPNQFVLQELTRQGFELIYAQGIDKTCGLSVQVEQP